MRALRVSMRRTASAIGVVGVLLATATACYPPSQTPTTQPLPPGGRVVATSAVLTDMLIVDATGDLDVDQHHTVEDVGICLGQALEKAVGDKKGIYRYGWANLPMDESLAQIALDLSGRPALVFNIPFKGPLIGEFAAELVEEFFKAVATSAKMNLHINVLYGSNNHHMAEAVFKGFARALRQAVELGYRDFDWIQQDPDLEGLKKYPEFLALVDQLKPHR